MTPNTYAKLIQFLQDELAVSPSSIDVALRQSQSDPGPLPMILWKYGLITIDQLNEIFDWLETA